MRAALAAIAILASSTASAQEPKGERLLGFGLTEGGVGYDATFAEAQRAGIQFAELPQQWDELESRPGDFTSPLLEVVNSYYPQAGLRVVIALNPIDTATLRLPADLQGKPFDDPAVIQRYTKLVDFVLGKIPEANLAAFSVGNEVDGVLGEDSAKWAQYTRFFKAVAAHVRGKRAGAVVGCKITSAALLAPKTRELATKLNAHADAVFTTYYPLDAEFQVKPPEGVHADFKALTAAYDGRPLYVLEAGYPAGAANGSSPAKQAEFVGALFAAWDRHRAQVRAVNLVWIHDYSAAEAKTYAGYYGLKDNAGFASFLGSLGLRTHGGRDKPAWAAVIRETKTRGW